jgi:hypothetical protein
MNEKKKLILLVVLFVVVAAIGVFQFARPPAAAPVPESRPEPSARPIPTSGSVPPTSGSVPTAPVHAGAIPSGAAPKDALPSSSSAPTGSVSANTAPAPAAPDSSPVGDSKPAPDGSAAVPGQTPDETVATLAPLAERDPFKPIVMPPPPDPVVGSAPTPPPSAAAPSKSHPDSHTGMIPPLSVINGQLPSATTDGPGKLTGPVSGLGLTGTVATFDYKLEGIIVGPHSAAVFTDAAGNERLVPLGGAIDGDTRLVKVGDGRVTVRFHGKDLRLTPGGNDSEN